MIIKPMNNYFYEKLLTNKFQYIDNLKYLSENKNNEIVFPVIFILNMFIIDFDTVSLNEFTNEDYQKILSFIDVFRDDESASITLSVDQALNIISFAKLGRVSYELNKEIVLLLAEYYNKDIDDEIFKYNLETLENVCNLIEENH